MVDIVDLEFFSKASFAEGTSASPQIALFLLATYGEGEPTDNAKTFYEWVKSEEARIPGVRYSGASLCFMFDGHFLIESQSWDLGILSTNITILSQRMSTG